MSQDEESRRRIAQCEAAVKQFREEQESYLAMLDFDWRQSPQTDHGEIAGNPLGAPEGLSFMLSGGHLIRLRDWHQYFVYAGTLCGVPPDPEDHLIAALKTAQRLFPEFGARPILLEPVFHGATFKTRPGSEPYPYPLIWLPKVCSIALFESARPARDPAGVFSALVIIWFQEHYGLPDEVYLRSELQRHDWAVHAVDWMP